MIKIYLCDSEKQAYLLRRYIHVYEGCDFSDFKSIMPSLNSEVKKSIKILHKYAERNIEKELKKCKLFAKITDKELAAEISEKDSYEVSRRAKAILESICIAAKNSERFLNELKAINKFEIIQKAIQTGKDILMVEEK